jgi:ketosteroid isomerase-like protein
MSGSDKRERSNLELARHGLSTWSRGDLEGSLATMHPEVEWHVAFRLPDMPADKDVYHGHAEVRELWAVFRSVWEEITIELEEILWEGPDAIVGRVRFRAKGGASGIEVDRAVFYGMEIRDGLLQRIRPFDDEASAREAVGGGA